MGKHGRIRGAGETTPDRGLRDVDIANFRNIISIIVSIMSIMFIICVYACMYCRYRNLGI